MYTIYSSFQSTEDWLHSIFSSMVKSMGIPAKFWFYFPIPDWQSRNFTFWKDQID